MESRPEPALAPEPDLTPGGPVAGVDAPDDAAPAGMLEVPLDAFFQLQLCVPRLRPLPPLDGSLRGWPATALLPDLSLMHFQACVGTVRLGWSIEGLAVGVAADVGHALRLDGEHPFRSDGVELWIDTRDSRTARKPTRFCHHFLVLPGGDGPAGRRPLLREMNPGGVKRAEDMADLTRIRAAARIPGPAGEGAQGYALEVFLPREVLFGYAPLESNSIAFAYRLRSSVFGVQDLAFGDRFPLWRNPSLWLSTRLEGAGGGTR